MNQSRIWTVGAVLLIIGLLAGTWFLGVAPRLTDARDADSAHEQAISLNTMHRQTLAALQADHERLDEIVSELDEAHSVLPELPEVSRHIASLGALARQSGATVSDLTVSPPAAYVPSDDATGEYLAVATELANGGLYVVDVTITARGSESALLNFVAALQAGQRLMLVHDAQLLKEEDLGPSVSIRAQIFGFSVDSVVTPEPTAPAPAAP